MPTTTTTSTLLAGRRATHEWLVSDDFARVSNAEVWRAVTDLREMTPGSSPLVRQVERNTSDIRALRFRYYAILGGVGTGVVTVVAILARSVGV